MKVVNKTLRVQLEEKKDSFSLQADDHIKKIYKEGIEAVQISGILENALNVGDMVPQFQLKNALGKSVALSDYLEKGTVILTWYRGSWCPYCNLTLKALQNELPNFRAHGAHLIALTPEQPDKSLSTAEKHGLQFEILSDPGNRVAGRFGLVFKLTDPVAETYNAKFSLKDFNGDQSNELPLAATYIIDKNGLIIYAFLNSDYRKRAEPSEITEFIRKKGLGG